MLFSEILWTFCFILALRGATKKFGELSSKNYRIHVLLAWLFLMFNNSGFKMLGWAVFHPSAISKYFYIPVGPMPAWFNLSTWAANLIASIVSILLALALAKRKDLGRKRLLKYLPVLYPIAVIEFVKGFYKAGRSENIVPIFIAFAIGGVAIAILYLPIFLFYRKEEVSREIFRHQIEKKS